MVIGPHLFGLLCVRSVEVTVRFADTPMTVTNRRAGASEAHEAVERLYAGVRGE